MSPAPAAPPSDAARERLQVMLPPPRLAAGFVCMVVRRVQPHEAGEPLLAPVHANPYACFNVVLRGEVQARGEALPASFLVGPLSQPLQTKVAGELLSLSLVLQPWLLAPLFAIRAADLRDRIVPADDHSLMARWTAPARDALATGEFAGFWQLLASQQPQVTPPDLALGVLQHSGVAAAAAATGCSERQYRRRFHNSMGTAPAT